MDTLPDILEFSVFASTVTAAVVTLFLCIPAWKLTKEKGFLWLSASALVDLGLTFITFTRLAVDPAMATVYYYVYWTSVVVSNILFTIGIVLIVKRFLKLFEASHNKPSEVSQ